MARNPDVSFLRSAKLERMNYIYKHSIDVIAFLTICGLGVVLAVVKVMGILFCQSRKKESQKVKLN